jgi:hypothetical protein
MFGFYKHENKISVHTKSVNFLESLIDMEFLTILGVVICRGADKSLAQPGRKQATATEDFEFCISYL